MRLVQAKQNRGPQRGFRQNACHHPTDDLTLFRPLLPLVSHKRGPRQVADCVEPPLRFNYHQD
jgi:hypothetical protein